MYRGTEKKLWGSGKGVNEIKSGVGGILIFFIIEQVKIIGRRESTNLMGGGV